MGTQTHQDGSREKNSHLVVWFSGLVRHHGIGDMGGSVNFIYGEELADK